MAPDNFKGDFVGTQNSFCNKCEKETEHRIERGTQKKGASEIIINIRKHTCTSCGDFKYELLDKVDKGELLTEKNRRQYHRRLLGYIMLLGYFVLVSIASILNFFEYKIIKRNKN